MKRGITFGSLVSGSATSPASAPPPGDLRRAAQQTTGSGLLKALRWAKDYGTPEVVLVELETSPVSPSELEDIITTEIEAYLDNMPSRLVDHFNKVYKRV